MLAVVTVLALLLVAVVWGVVAMSSRKYRKEGFEQSATTTVKTFYSKSPEKRPATTVRKIHSYRTRGKSDIAYVDNSDDTVGDWLYWYVMYDLIDGAWSPTAYYSSQFQVTDFSDVNFIPTVTLPEALYGIPECDVIDMNLPSDCIIQTPIADPVAAETLQSNLQNYRDESSYSTPSNVVEPDHTAVHHEYSAPATNDSCNQPDTSYSQPDTSYSSSDSSSSGSDF